MKVIVSIDAVLVSDGERQQTSQTANGFLRRCENSFELSYREQSGDDGLGNTLTTLRVFADRVELSRQGDYRCLLTLEVGNRHEAPYHTPFGTMMLTTDTARLCAAFDDDGTGELTVCYSLFAGGDSTQHELHLTTKPA